MQRTVNFDTRSQEEVDLEKAEAALNLPSMSYAKLTETAESRIRDLRDASVKGALQPYAERAVGAYALWHDVTRGARRPSDNKRLSELAGMPEPLL